MVGICMVNQLHGQYDAGAENPLEPLLEPLVEVTGALIRKAVKKVKKSSGTGALKVTQEYRQEIRKIFLGDFEKRIQDFEKSLSIIFQNLEPKKILLDQIILIKRPLEQYIASPKFTLARGMTPAIFYNLSMYVKNLQQTLLDELEKATSQNPLPLQEAFEKIIAGCKEEINKTEELLMKDLVGKSNAEKTGVSGSSVKIDRKSKQKVASPFDELIEGTTVALKLVEQDRYLAQSKGIVELSMQSSGPDGNSQFVIERYGQGFRLKGKFGYLGVRSTSKEIFCSEKSLSDEVTWLMQGNELGSLSLKNKKLGYFLAVTENNEIEITSSADKATRFSCFTLSRPWDMDALDTSILKNFSAGTTVALKLKGMSDLDGVEYLAVDANGFLRAIKTKSSDWRCQFDVMRFGNYVGLKQIGWKNICVDFESQLVYVAQRSSRLFSVTEQWMIDPEKPDNLQSVRLRNRATGGYLRIQTDWSNGRASTAGGRDTNPIKTFSSLTTLPDYIYSAATKEQASVFEVEIKQPVPVDTEPGKSSLHFIPAVHGKNTVLFHKNWHLNPAAGKTIIASGIQASASVYIGLSDKPMGTKESMYILFGDEKNTRSGIRVFGSMAVSVTEKQNSDAVITAPTESVWVRIKDTIVAFGKGKIAGEHEIARVQLEKDFVQKLTYFGFGGGGNRVTIESISWENR